MFAENSNFIIPSKKVEDRINKIISKLNLKDKIHLLGGHSCGQSTKSVEHADIPEFKMADGPVGVHWWCETSTAYPALICAAATWDSDLINKMGIGLGRDARARGVHILLAPGVNIYRSPLCGRNFEYFGEDPFLASQMAVQYIKGVQSMGVAATVKHYALNFQEYDRNNISSDVDERTLHEIYLPAFKAAVQEGGSGCLMTSYNLKDGIHCSENKELINDILKNDWGFDGLVMSDWDSTYSSVDAANNGLDLEMPFAKWFNNEKLLLDVEEGRVKIEVIDDKIRRLLRLAVCFGWLENKQKDDSIPMNDPVTAKISLDIARNGIVLLKNEDNLLPLSNEKVKKVAVIGKFIHPDPICGGGSSYTPANRVSSVIDGIRKQADGVEILYTLKPDPYRDVLTYKNSKFQNRNNQDGLLGEYFDNNELAGNPVSTRTDSQINFLWDEKKPVQELTAKEYSIRWTGEITPDEDGVFDFYSKGFDCQYRIWLDNKLIEDLWDNDLIIAKEHNPADKVHKNSVPLKIGKKYNLKIELKKTGRWSKFFFGWENSRNFDNELKAALDIAKEADAVIVCAGFDKTTEQEGFDRTFGLHENYEKLINSVSALNSNTVVLLHAGGGVEMSQWLKNVKGLLQIWYPGQEGGTAIGEILWGKVNPSGKLPISVERNLEDNSSYSCYHDQNSSKHVELTDGIFCGYRHYDRENIEPLFPFGFGLSYTEFSYSNLKLSGNDLDSNSEIDISFDITNTGNRDGSETAQLYISDTESSLPRPVKELKGFEKVFLKAGEYKTVTMKIDISHLKFYKPEIHEWIYESGEFKLLIGASSKDIRLETKFIGL